MSHTPARNKQADIEHIRIAAGQFGQTLMQLQAALQTAVSDDGKIALLALIEIAEAGLSAARKCEEQMHVQAASGSVH